MDLRYDDINVPDGTSDKIRRALDSVYAGTGTGVLSTAMTDTLRGMNHRRQPGSVKMNKDDYGMTFFTRPRMNMTTPNVRQIREFTSMLSTQELSIPRYIRAVLDTDSAINGHGSALVDEYQAFIPILTNQLISMSGWPDVKVDMYTSPSGAYREEFSIADGVTRNFSTYDITANFRNIEGDPITALFLTWCHYMSFVFQGLIVPYPDMIIENEIDYQTRIYRFVLDPSRRYITKWACNGASMPQNSSIAAAFDFESDNVYNRSNEQLTVQFRSMGAMYNDEIILSEFNQTAVSQNSRLGGTDTDREHYFTKVPNDLANYFNGKSAYPYVNEATRELEWWVPNADYQEILTNLAEQLSSGSATGTDQ